MITIRDLVYIHPNNDLLFENINLTVNKHDKIALVGKNGSGKSTFLKIISGLLQASGGLVSVNSKPYYLPQLSGQFDDSKIAQALKIDDKIKALKQILAGHVTEENFELLNDDWTIEKRSMEALAYWGLNGLSLEQRMKNLSDGQKTRVFLSGITIHQPEIILLDEPSNHLDASGRNLLYHYVQSSSDTLIVVSHDRKLLNLLNSVYELSKKGITTFGGNYEFYVRQKIIEKNALNQNLQNKEKALRKAKDLEKKSVIRQHKLDARGKKKQTKAGTPVIMMKTLKNNAEKSTSRIKSLHTEKINAISKDLNQLRNELPDKERMKFGLDNSTLHTGKILIMAKNINFSYGRQLLWKEPLNFLIASGERVVIKGLNGSGKTSLVKIILGQLDPKSGSIYRAGNKAVYIDQDYSQIHNPYTVYEQAQRFYLPSLREHELKIRLNWFLFSKDDWSRSCKDLSGGEKMRLMLCCLTLSNKTPDMIVVDEPTNNLDIQNIELLTSALSNYQGTLLVVSHDEYFLEELKIEKTIKLRTK